jgi:hypothetical protein
MWRLSESCEDMGLVWIVYVIMVGHLSTEQLREVMWRLSESCYNMGPV